MTLALGDAEVHVWLAFDERARDPALLDRYQALLSATERERWQRIKPADDQLRHVVSRGLTRSVLSMYEPRVRPADWTFTRNAHGRPEIAPAHGVRNLFFNLAHTGGLTALALARQQAIGVDVENTALRAAPFDVARRHFSAAETGALDALSGVARQRRFFELWTLKEAYLKATGTGLTNHLDRVCFIFDGAQVRFDLPDAGAGCWNFALLQPGAAHLLALAMSIPGPAALSVRVREITAGGASHELALPTGPRFLRSGQEQRTQA
jgi:4'-phosphopantetheinyl transferase